MPTNHTPNYQLSQWERDDRILMEDFNADNAKIDAAIKAEAEVRAAETHALAQSRNCQFFYATYVGTGTFGESAPNRLVFPHKPIFVLVEGDRAQNFSAVWGSPYAPEPHSSADPGVMNLSWSDRSLGWYSAMGPGRQLNDKGETYYVFAILELEE